MIRSIKTIQLIVVISVFIIVFTACNKTDVAKLILTKPTATPKPVAEYQQLAKLDDAIQASQEQAIFLFKHSNACPISAAAKDVMDQFVKEDENPVYMVVVQTERPMSNKIEEHFAIKHESPQLLVVNDGKVQSVYNHYEIRRDHIVEDLKSM